MALVTGGASGIGAACVHAFVRGGAKVAIVDRDQDLGAKTLTDVREAGGDAIFLPVDVAQPEAVEAMVADTIAAFGHLDIAVNNAGIGGEPNPTGSYSIEGWQKVIDVNLNGVFYCMRYEIPAMLAQGGGVIVNMAWPRSLGRSDLRPPRPVRLVARKMLAPGCTRGLSFSLAQEWLLSTQAHGRDVYSSIIHSCRSIRERAHRRSYEPATNKPAP